MEQSKPRRASRRTSRVRPRTVVSGLVAGALAVPALAWSAGADFTDVPPTSAAFRAINTIVDAGVMGGFGTKFRPDQHVTRRLLAQTLHRGLPRASVDDTIADIPTSQPDPPVIAETNMSIDGIQPGAQGVLLELVMQVESAQPLGADCDVVLQATSWPENFDAGSWTVRMYAAERHAEVVATFDAGQLAATAYTYQVTADNGCGQALDVVQGSLTARSVAVQGSGSPFPETG